MADRSSPKKTRYAGKVWAVTLGCPKNRVDTEVMLGDLLSNGYAWTYEPEDADVVLVNTCGFLQSARQESLEVLGDIAALISPHAKLVAAGCMVQSFKQQIQDAVPRVDVFVGVNELLTLRQILEETPSNQLVASRPTAANPRLVTSLPPSAYLKVSDGCNRRCSFCIIPHIKGPQYSRPVDDVLNEASSLAMSGVRELVLVAQDLSRYGVDLGEKTTLFHLLDRMVKELPKIDWIRLMYLYPQDLDDRVLELMNHEGSTKLLKYLDIPVQHADDNVLKAMRRGTKAEDMLSTIERIRGKVPGAMLRTTYLVGHPGETDQAFDNLIAFAKTAKFDMAGVFVFSPEPGSHAASLPDQVPDDIKEQRLQRLEEVLSDIAATKRAAQISEIHQAVVEDLDFSRRTRHQAVGRFWFQAPEIDGSVIFKARNIEPGQMLDLRIVDIKDNDFIGEIVSR